MLPDGEEKKITYVVTPCFVYYRCTGPEMYVLCSNKYVTTYKQQTKTQPLVKSCGGEKLHQILAVNRA